MNKFSFLSLGLACVVSTAGLADSVVGQWSIVGFSGEPWYVEAQELIGKNQTFQGGFSEGPFYGCNYSGQSMTYTAYSNDEFFANPEFALFLSLREGMILSSERLFVHRITCNGNGNMGSRRVLYPFVTNEARASAWYLFEGGVFSFYRP